MKNLFLSVFLFFSVNLHAQNTVDTGDVSVVILNTTQGLYFNPQIQTYYPVSEYLSYNPRVGFAFSINNNSYWYLQSGLLYRRGIFRAGFYPVWLRAYNREIGYQTPSSLMVGYNSPLKLTSEIWVDYWNGKFLPSLLFTFKLHSIEHR
jgi:hypothetical protein